MGSGDPTAAHDPHGGFFPSQTESALRRERLFHLLDKASPQCVVWICGPAGSGKTVLAATYLSSRGIPGIWRRFDASDNDHAAFFRPSKWNSDTSFPKNTNPPHYAPKQLSDLPRFFQDLFAHHCSCPPGACCFVFDNLERLTRESGLRDLLCDAVHAASSRIRLFIISRGSPPSSFVRLRVEGGMIVLCWNELRFSLEETRQFLVRGKYPEDGAEALHAVTEGWAAGLALAVQDLGPAAQHAFTPESLSRNGIFDYFDHEVLPALTPEERRFLLKTAFLPALTPQAAAILNEMDQDKAEEVLSALTRANHFIFRPDPTGLEYPRHPLFQEYLLALAEKSFAPEELTVLRRLTGEQAEATGFLDEALELLHLSGDPKALAGLIARQAENLLLQGRLKTLERWLTLLTPEQLDRDASLLFWAGVCRLHRSPAESRLLFERAHRIFSADRDLEGALQSWCGAVDAYIYDWDDSKALDAWIETMDRLLSEMDRFPSPRAEAAVAFSLAGALLQRRPDHPDLGKWINKALETTKHRPRWQPHILPLFNAACHAMWMGDLAGLRRIVHNITETLRASPPSPFFLPNAKCLQALVYTLCDARGEQALAEVEEGLEIGAATGVRNWDFMLLAQKFFAWQTIGNTDRAMQCLDRMRAELPQGRRFDLSQLHYLTAWLYMYQEDALRAEHHAREAMSLCLETGCGFALPLYRMALAQVCHELGKSEECRKQMEQAAAVIRPAGSRMLHFMWLVAAAHFRLGSGQEPRGLELLDQAMTLGREQDYLNMFWWWRPRVMARLCATALEQGLEPDYARRLILARDLFPDPPPLENELWPWPMRVKTLGGFALLRDGEPLAHRRKAQRKPLLLLKALVALGGREVAESRLSDILWPDADGAAAHSAFTTTLSRLRNLLGGKEFVLFHDGMASLNPRLCRTDVSAFESAARRLLTLMEEDLASGPGKGLELSADEFLDLVRKVLNLYPGHFLEEEYDHPWTVPTRERLRMLFRTMVLEVGEFLRRRGDHARLEALMRQILGRDPLEEDFHSLLVNCCLQQGKRTEAARAYRYCRDILFATFGIEPSFQDPSRASSSGSA